MAPPDSKHTKLYDRLTRLRWQAPLLAIVLVLLHQLLEHTLLIHLSRWHHFATQVLFYGAVGPLLAWWALSSLRRSAGETDKAERHLRRSQAELEKSNRRLEFLIEVNHRLAEAQDEEDLIQIMLTLPGEVIPLIGASLMRFDEHDQPLPAAHSGGLDPELFEAWARHLSQAEVQDLCRCCTAHDSAQANACPMLDQTFSVQRVACLPITRNDRRFGLLNLYLSDASRPSSDEQQLLETMASEMSLAMESMLLKSRELETLYRLQRVRRLTDLQADLASVLSSTVEAFEVDGALLMLQDAEGAGLRLVAEAGATLGTAARVVTGIARGVLETRGPAIMQDLELADQSTRALLIAPLTIHDRVLGAMLLWSEKPEAFTRRHTRLLETLAGQAALLVENHRLFLRAEHSAVLAERSRLAREIHDGIAQVLGYLKLRVSQLTGWMQSGDAISVIDGLHEVEELIGEAYSDAREAIDGLRLETGELELREWIDQVVHDFQDSSSIQVEAQSPPEVDLDPEVQAQLLRILQEALGNIRKHSNAKQAKLSWHMDSHGITLQISDNGGGFEPHAISPIERHGLRTMRERAELIGADFQIASRIGSGTDVILRLPKTSLEMHG